MHHIFVNLKRFEVPRSLGGLCPTEDPVGWIASVIGEAVEVGIGERSDTRTVFLLPEGLVTTAVTELRDFERSRVTSLAIGCQGVHWEDVSSEGNFGAFTSSLPARAAKNLGATWSIIGHSEERKAKLQVIAEYDPEVERDQERKLAALNAVDRIIRSEVICALEAGLNVLLCIGETSEQRGEGTEQVVADRLESVLRSQLSAALQGAERFTPALKIAIGYEPIWAIGPGKVPPGQAYISRASSYAKAGARERLGVDVPIVYGGGLKQENAEMIASIETIDGGLVALTRFTGEIGFDVHGLKSIIDRYRQAGPQAAQVQ